MGFKTREMRRKVSLPVQLRGEGARCDAVIRSASSRGMTIAVRGPAPRRGSYVDIRRGLQTMTGRVQWSEGNCIGVRLQDRIDVAALVAGPVTNGGGHAAAAPRPASSDRARQIGSTIQYAVLLGVPAGAIAYAGWTLSGMAEPVLAQLLKVLG